jgi:branched-chain amino acid transport system permease protein
MGFTLIFGVLQLIAFAQGGIYMLGSYAGLLAVASIGTENKLLAIAAAVLAAATLGALVNIGIDRIGYRPIRGSKRLMPLISGIGLYILIENGAGLIFGKQPRPVVISLKQIIVVAIALACMGALYLFITRTGSGLAMRATAERPSAAGLMGVNPEKVIIITFALAGAMSGIAGVLVGSYIGVATPIMGFLIGLKAFAAAVIGGIGNIPGSLIGGLAIGVIEAMGAGYISSAWGDALVFGALVVVLLIKPEGLFGRRSVVKV